MPIFHAQYWRVCDGVVGLSQVLLHHGLCRVLFCHLSALLCGVNHPAHHQAPVLGGGALTRRKGPYTWLLGIPLPLIYLTPFHPRHSTHMWHSQHSVELSRELCSLLLQLHSLCNQAALDAGIAQSSHVVNSVSAGRIELLPQAYPQALN